LTAKPPPAVPEALQHLHGLIALSLAKEYGFTGKEALDLATACTGQVRASVVGGLPSGEGEQHAAERETRLRRHENVELVHNALSLALMRRSVRFGDSLSANDLAEELCLELQRAVGGLVGFYLPRPVSMDQQRANRNERIRRMAGPAPHSVKKAKKIAREVGCSFSTVWRAIMEGTT
jgi:hypothetical protein